MVDKVPTKEDLANWFGFLFIWFVFFSFSQESWDMQTINWKNLPNYKGQIKPGQADDPSLYEFRRACWKNIC